MEEDQRRWRLLPPSVGVFPQGGDNQLSQLVRRWLSEAETEAKGAEQMTRSSNKEATGDADRGWV